MMITFFFVYLQVIVIKNMKKLFVNTFQYYPDQGGCFLHQKNRPYFTLELKRFKTKI